MIARVRLELIDMTIYKVQRPMFGHEWLITNADKSVFLPTHVDEVPRMVQDLMGKDGIEHFKQFMHLTFDSKGKIVDAVKAEWQVW